MMRGGRQRVTALGVLVVSAGLIHASATPAQKCAVAKLKAAAMKMSGELKCYREGRGEGQLRGPWGCERDRTSGRYVRGQHRRADAVDNYHHYNYHDDPLPVVSPHGKRGRLLWVVRQRPLLSALPGYVYGKCAGTSMRERCGPW